MKIEVQPTSFTSEGETLRGHFVLPQGTGPFPAICKFHGLPGSSDQISGIATRLAATKADPDKLKEFEELFDVADKEPDENKRRRLYDSTGDKLHDYILAVCGNKRIIEIIDTYKILLKKERQIAAAIPGRIEESLKEHRAVLEALKKKDSDLAERAMRQHIVGTLNTILESYRK